LARLESLSFSGAFLQRGFWLYVWEVTAGDGRTVLYVGRTGDSASANAQSPFTRFSQHLSTNTHANALRRQLLAAGIDPIACRSFEMTAYGPILPEAETMADHVPRRDQIAAMEKALRDALHAAGYIVLNEVHSLHNADALLWQDACNAFASRFPKLRPRTELYTRETMRSQSSLY